MAGAYQMKRAIIAALALALLLGLQPRAARADNSNLCNNSLINFLNAGQDCRLFWGSVGISIGTGVAGYYLTEKRGTPPHRPMTAWGAYGVTTAGCIVAYPFVGTFLLNRPLTPREMYDGVGGCIVPVIGSWLVDQWLPHTAWVDGTPVKGH
jgi:hypothetical protein